MNLTATSEDIRHWRIAISSSNAPPLSIIRLTGDVVFSDLADLANGFWTNTGSSISPSVSKIPTALFQFSVGCPTDPTDDADLEWRHEDQPWAAFTSMLLKVSSY